MGVSKGRSKDGDANLTIISSNAFYFENAPSMSLYPTLKHKGSPSYACIIMIIEGSKQNYGMYPNSQGISQGFG